ncbi:MAG: PIN domain-containing protein, partial [Coriobacteriia bacterium]
GALGGFAVSQQVDWTAGTGYSETFVIIIFIILGASIGYILGGIIGREFNVACRTISARLSEMDTPALLLGAVGLLVGLLVAFILSSALLRYIERPLWLGFAATALLFMMCAYAGVALFMLPARDGTLSLGITGTPVDSRPPKLLDTSAIIDGRFADLASTGVLEGPLRVPRFVLMELQTLADSVDDGRRARGRRGLDLLTSLSAAETAVQVFEADFPEIPTVDAKLVRLALTSGGVLVTVDHNLTKVARVEGATVLNVHEVADALKPVLLPGDSLRIEITKEGKERDQGVGYLGDGTMVVITDGADRIGSEVDVRVTTVLQTAGGRMVFAKRVTSE